MKILNAFKKRPNQNSSNIKWKVNQFKTDSLFSLDQNREGVYGYEISDGNRFLITPSHDRDVNGEESDCLNSLLLNDLKELSCYSVFQEKPSFLPLFQQENNEILTNLLLLETKLTKIYAQLLASERRDDWKESAIDQYQEYLNGNDFPSVGKLGRKVQGRVLNMLNKMSGHHMKRKQIEEIEEKILERGFWFEFRIIVHGEQVDTVNEIEALLKELDFYNQLRLYPVKNKKKFVEDFISRKLISDQMLCESELKSLVSEAEAETDNASIKKTVTIDKVIETARESVKSGSGLIGILPIGKKKDRVMDSSIGDKVINSLKRVGVVKSQKIEVRKNEMGSTLQRITLTIPKGINYSDIEKNYKNIKATLGIDSLTIEQGDEPDTISFMIPCSEREAVHLRELMENKEFIKFAEESILPFYVGVDVLGKPIYKDLAKMPHLLIAGTTGSGKSVFLNTLILVMLIMKRPSELTLFLIDPKKVEFTQFNGFPHVQEVITDMKKANTVLSSLVNEMEKRYDVLSEHGYKTIHAYNKTAQVKIPSIVCVIDEFNDLRIQFPNVEEYIERLGQKARAAGVHLIVATQRPDSNVLSGVVKANLPSVVCFRLKNHNDYRTVFGTGQPYHLLGKGDGVMKLEGQIKEFERFQGAVISLDEDEEQEVYKAIRSKLMMESPGDIIPLEDVEHAHIEPMEVLKTILATTGETRIRELQKELGIKTNLVSEMMHTLMEEGWLEKAENKKGYQIVADASELEKYKSMMRAE